MMSCAFSSVQWNRRAIEHEAALILMHRLSTFWLLCTDASGKGNKQQSMINIKFC